MSLNMYQMNLDQVNAELDRLYGRQWHMEECSALALDVDDDALWRESYTNLTERILELEQRQYELIEADRQNNPGLYRDPSGDYDYLLATWGKV